MSDAETQDSATSAQDVADSSTAPDATSRVDKSQLTVPRRAKKAFWGDPIYLHIDHAARKESGQPDAYCFDCGVDLKFYSSTGNIDCHMKAKHKNRKSTNKTEIKNYMGQTPTFKRALIKWLVLTYQPLSVTEHESFREMIASISASLKIPSRRELCDALDGLEEQARAAILEALQGQMLAITTDAWTSAATESYLSLTVHYLDEAFHMQTLPVECAAFSGSHTGERIKEKIYQMLERSGVSADDVSAMVADNAANQVLAGELCSFDSVPCAPHTLQLTVKDILEDPVCQSLLKKVRKIVGAFKHSALKGQELREQQSRYGLKHKRLLQDVKTRWSSTYLCITTMCENKAAVRAVCAMHAPVRGRQARKKQRTEEPTATAGVSSAPANDANESSTETPPAVVHKTRAVTRTQTKALVVVPGALAGMHTDSEHYSSSDDGSVDLEIEGNRCGISSDSDSQSARDTIDLDDSSSDEDPPVARKASRGNNGRTGSARGRSGAARGRGKPSAPKKSKGKRSFLDARESYAVLATAHSCSAYVICCLQQARARVMSCLRPNVPSVNLASASKTSRCLNCRKSTGTSCSFCKNASSLFILHRSSWRGRSMSQLAWCRCGSTNCASTCRQTKPGMTLIWQSQQGAFSRTSTSGGRHGHERPFWLPPWIGEPSGWASSIKLIVMQHGSTLQTKPRSSICAPTRPLRTPKHHNSSPSLRLTHQSPLLQVTTMLTLTRMTWRPMMQTQRRADRCYRHASQLKSRLTKAKVRL